MFWLFFTPRPVVQEDPFVFHDGEWLPRKFFKEYIGDTPDATYGEMLRLRQEHSKPLPHHKR